MSDTVLVAIISGVVSLIINIGSRILDKRDGLADDIASLSKDIKDIKKDVGELKSNDEINGDMIYQMLDHLSTNNNTGEMSRALEQYNAHFRHNE